MTFHPFTCVHIILVRFVSLSGHHFDIYPKHYDRMYIFYIKQKHEGGTSLSDTH